MKRFLNLPVAGQRAVIEKQKEAIGLPGMSIEMLFGKPFVTIGRFLPR